MTDIEAKHGKLIIEKIFSDIDMYAQLCAVYFLRKNMNAIKYCMQDGTFQAVCTVIKLYHLNWYFTVVWLFKDQYVDRFWVF